MQIPSTAFSCPENSENGGTHFWFSKMGDETLLHTLGPWSNGWRAEHIVCLSESELERFKKQVAEL